MSVNKEMKTIDMTPTWYGILPVLLVLLESSSAEARKTANEELQKMARAADLYNKGAK